MTACEDLIVCCVIARIHRNSLVDVTTLHSAAGSRSRCLQNAALRRSARFLAGAGSQDAPTETNKPATGAAVVVLCYLPPRSSAEVTSQSFSSLPFNFTCLLQPSLLLVFHYFGPRSSLMCIGYALLLTLVLNYISLLCSLFNNSQTRSDFVCGAGCVIV